MDTRAVEDHSNHKLLGSAKQGLKPINYGYKVIPRHG